MGWRSDLALANVLALSIKNRNKPRPSQAGSKATTGADSSGPNTRTKQLGGVGRKRRSQQATAKAGGPRRPARRRSSQGRPGRHVPTGPFCGSQQEPRGVVLCEQTAHSARGYGFGAQTFVLGQPPQRSGNRAPPLRSRHRGCRCPRAGFRQGRSAQQPEQQCGEASNPRAKDEKEKR